MGDIDNDPTKTANKRRLKKGTIQEGTGGRTQKIIRLRGGGIRQ